KESPFELIDGERISLRLTTFGEAILCNNWYSALHDDDPEGKIGQAYLRTTFVFTDPHDPHLISASRRPELIYLRTERIAAYKQSNPEWEDQPLKLVPDLVSDIVSPNDTCSGINAKVQQYLKDGVPLVWILDGERQTVTAHSANSNVFTTYHADQ